MTNETTHNDLANADVYDSEGHKIGGVNNVYVFDGTDEPSWITVNTGFFGAHETFIPLANSQLNSGGLVVPYTKSFVKDAPNIDPDGELSVEQENELFRYYGIDNPNAVRQAAAGHGGQDARDDRAGHDGHFGQDGRVGQDARAEHGTRHAAGAPAADHQGATAGQPHDDRSALENEINGPGTGQGGAGTVVAAGTAGAGVGAGAVAANQHQPGEPAPVQDDRPKPADRRIQQTEASFAHPIAESEGEDAGGRHAADPATGAPAAAPGAGTTTPAPGAAAPAAGTATGAAAQAAPAAGDGQNIRLRKRIVTETKLVEVPVQREEVVVENPDGTVSPIDGAEGGTPTR